MLAASLLMACSATDPTPASIQISVDREAYVAGDTMVVRVTNRLDSIVASYDHQSFCWIARLDRRVARGWEPYGPCYSTEPAQEEPLGPGQSRVFRLPVANESDAYPAVVLTGEYRWEFTYSVGATFSFAKATRVTSGEFVVK